MAPDDVLKKLEYLSLVSKVCTELETHLGFGDKVLAEFITELGRNCEAVDEFDSKLKENDAGMPDYFVRTLLTIIHAILPPTRKSENPKETAGGGGGYDRQEDGRVEMVPKSTGSNSNEPELYTVYKGRVSREW
ncbi:unnamed protein product [Linum tenue]|uniref:Uncharacterized protein n=1 Tax=Linum tenue TaxID=586396 RepID=A0AAV0IQQ3_9ROSI|nr:unnamed protein product [Linum tenue]